MSLISFIYILYSIYFFYEKEGYNVIKKNSI